MKSFIITNGIMKSFIIMNGILLILAVVGSFTINKLVDEGIFMGVNRFFIEIYISILGVIGTIINLILTIFIFI